MGIIFPLLLIVSLASASPLIQGQRNGIDTDLSEGADQTQRSEVKERTYAPKPKIVPYNSNINQLKLSNLKDSDNLKLRPRRPPYKSVCHLGTCLLHNLGNSLHQLSKTEGKEGSKDANDPYGYGR